jgi:hypothetical protein
MNRKLTLFWNINRRFVNLKCYLTGKGRNKAVKYSSVLGFIAVINELLEIVARNMG